MGNHVGLLQTVLQRYWKVQGPVYTILQNIFQQILHRHNKLYKNTDKIYISENFTYKNEIFEENEKNDTYYLPIYYSGSSAFLLAFLKFNNRKLFNYERFNSFDSLGKLAKQEVTPWRTASSKVSSMGFIPSIARICGVTGSDISL